MTMNIAPGAILTATGLVVNVSATVYRFVTDQNVTTLLLSVANILCGLFLTVFILGAITTVTEWRSIYCPAWKKILFTFTFPPRRLEADPAQARRDNPADCRGGRLNLPAKRGVAVRQPLFLLSAECRIIQPGQNFMNNSRALH